VRRGRWQGGGGEQVQRSELIGRNRKRRAFVKLRQKRRVGRMEEVATAEGVVERGE
jgi:hypothetical protein